MSLEALAPDQRAVVQLVLQQGRSFADLAGLLGISEDAVRDRARRGLATLAAPPAGLDEDERAEVADYLLSQGSPSAREATRSLLRTAPDANAWAAALAGELGTLPGARLPDIPAARARPRPAAPAPAPAVDTADEPAGSDADAAAGSDAGAAAGSDADAAADPDTDAAADPEPTVRARPRPRPARAVPAGVAATSADAEPDEPPADEPVSSDRGAAPRSSRLGGTLLIAAIAIVVVAGIVFLLGRGGDDDTDSASSGSGTATAPASASPTATPTADSRYTALGQISLTGAQGSKAKGAMVLYADTKTNSLTFTVEGTGLQPNTNSDAYAVWLVGGGSATRLGYNRDSPVGSDGVLRVGSGTSAKASRRFTCRLADAKSVVVSLETRRGSVPQNPVMTGSVPAGADACKK